MLLTALAFLASGPSAFAEDVLCQSVREEQLPVLPEPVAGWMVVQCGEAGQSIVPRMAPVPHAWVRHGTAQSYAVEAAGQGAQAPAREPPWFAVAGARRFDPDEEPQIRALFRSSFPGSSTEPDADAIVLLALDSSAGGVRHNLIVYLWQGEARHMIHCLGPCRDVVPLDILNLDELGQRRSAAR